MEILWHQDAESTTVRSETETHYWFADGDNLKKDSITGFIDTGELKIISHSKITESLLSIFN